MKILGINQKRKEEEPRANLMSARGPKLWGTREIPWSRRRSEEKLPFTAPLVAGVSACPVLNDPDLAVGVEIRNAGEASAVSGAASGVAERCDAGLGLTAVENITTVGVELVLGNWTKPFRGHGCSNDPVIEHRIVLLSLEAQNDELLCRTNLFPCIFHRVISFLLGMCDPADVAGLRYSKYSIIYSNSQAKNKNQHFCCFYALNPMDFMIKNFLFPK